MRSGLSLPVAVLLAACASSRPACGPLPAGFPAFDRVPEGPHALVGRVAMADGRRIGGEVRVSGLPTDPLDFGDWDRRIVHGFVRDAPSVGEPRSFPLAADGFFRADGLAAGEYGVSVEFEDGSRVEWTRVRVPTVEPLLAAPPPPSRRLAGRLLDTASGGAVCGASVVAHWALARTPTHMTAYGIPVRSDPEGHFTVDVADTRCGICVEAAGYRRTCVQEFADGASVSLVPLGRVEGRVVDAAGAPVAGAAVHAGSALRATTDACGRFAIEGVEPRETSVFVRGGGWVSPDISEARTDGWHPFLVDVRPGSRVAVDLAAVPAASLTGRVLDADGRPVEGARVRALAVAGFAGPFGDTGRAVAGPDATTTDARGVFAVHDLVPGVSYELEASAPGWPRERVGRFGMPAVPGRAALPEVVVRLARPRFVGVHVVWLGTGAPVEGARALLLSSRPTIREHLVTDFDAPPNARGTGFTWTAPRVGWIPADDMGVATDAEGGARLGPVGPGSLAVLVAAEGVRFAGEPEYVPGSPTGTGPFEMTVRLARPSPEQPAVEGARAKPSVPPAPKPTLDITVLDPEGLPVPSASVTFVAPRADAHASVTKGKARFDLDASGPDTVRTVLAAGGSYVVVAGVWKEGAPLPYSPAVVGPLAPDAQSVEVRLEPERAIEGRVTDEEGRPLRGVLLRVEGRAPPPANRRMSVWATSARTDANGAFRLGRLPAGTHRVEVHGPPDFLPPGTVEAAAGARDVAIRLRRGASMQVTVLDETGAPVPGARVTYGSLGLVGGGRGGSRWRWPETALDGTVRLRGLEPDAFLVLHVEPLRERGDLFPADLPEARPSDVVVRLQRGVVIAGSVEDAQGKAVNNAAVEIRIDGITYRPVVEWGRFRAVRLPVGRALVKAGLGTVSWDDPTAPPVVVDDGADDILLTLK